MPDLTDTETESTELAAQIKESKPDVQAYVVALKKALRKQVARNADLEAAAHSAQFTIQSQRDKLHSHDVDISNLTEEETDNILLPVAIQHIKNTGGIEAFIKKYELDRDNLNSQ